MKTVANKHAHIDLEDKEVNELFSVLDFLETLNDTITNLEKENTSWDIRCENGEGEYEFFDIIDTLNYLSNRLLEGNEE